MSKRPNILFLMSDEHRADVTGFEGNTVVRTPVLDELAATGVVFRNCYAPSPICIPARQCMAAGQLPRTCGVEQYGQDLPPFSMTFAEQFSRHAYATACFGKLHHVGRDQMQGWMQRPMGDISIMERHVDERCHESFAAIKEGMPAGLGKWSDTKEVYRTMIGKTKYGKSDLAWTDATCSFINDYFTDFSHDRSRGHQPLLLKQSLIQPHYPYGCDEEVMRYYINRVTPFTDEPVFDHPFLSMRQVKTGAVATAFEIRRTTAAYYGMVEAIDGHYGTVLDRLRAVGQDLDDWIIIYTSDHGEMLGEHGIWEKQKFFEASARVPLIIRWPKQFAPRVVEENVNQCDLFATLCELCDIPLPAEADTVNGAGLDSRSLVGLMGGDAENWDNESISQFGASNLMIKQGALKYQRYDRDDCSQQAEVLFDLAREPDEKRNLINEARYQKEVAAFRLRCAALGFGPEADPNYRNAGY